MVFYAAFNSISVISQRQLTLFTSFLGFTSAWPGSEVSCPRTLPRKSPEDPVWLEPRTPGLRVNHHTTEPRWTLVNKTKNVLENGWYIQTLILSFYAEFTIKHVNRAPTVIREIYFSFDEFMEQS